MKGAKTFDAVMREAKGVATGFDYLRLGLSLYVLLSHCFSTPDPEDGRFVWDSAFGPIHRSVLPMFFALSGFLVAGSFARNTIVKFVTLRALRIVPALAVETALGAVLIGIAFTTLPLGDYFRSTGFWAYFLNIVGDIHYTLPGVFDGMKVNSQLWTIPFEFQCYAALVVVSLAQIGKRRDIVLIATIAACCLMTYAALANNLVNSGPCAPRLVFIFSFFAGVCLHMYKDKVVYRRDLFFTCIGAAYLFLHFNNLVFLSPLPVAYLTMYIGLAKLPKVGFGDLSYGIYLFHSPILICIYNLTGRQTSWEFLLLAGLPLTLVFAFLSWNLIENPILKRKAPILRFVDAISARFGRALPASAASKPLTGSTPAA